MTQPSSACLEPFDANTRGLSDIIFTDLGYGVAFAIRRS